MIYTYKDKKMDYHILPQLNVCPQTSKKIIKKGFKDDAWRVEEKNEERDIFVEPEMK